MVGQGQILAAKDARGPTTLNPALVSGTFDPETVKSYEIGFKSEFFDHRARLNVTAYRQDFKNYAYSSRNVFIAGARSVNGALVNNVFTAGPAIAVPGAVTTVGAWPGRPCPPASCTRTRG